MYAYFNIVVYNLCKLSMGRGELKKKLTVRTTKLVFIHSSVGLCG